VCEGGYLPEAKAAPSTSMKPSAGHAGTGQPASSAAGSHDSGLDGFRAQPPSIESAMLHVRGRPFQDWSVFVPRSAYQLRLNQVRYFLAVAVLHLTNGADAELLCRRVGISPGVISKLWHDLASSARQVLQVARSLGYDVLHAVLGRMTSRLSRGAAGVPLALMRGMPSLRRHFAVRLARAGIRSVQDLLSRPVEEIARELRNALPYAAPSGSISAACVDEPQDESREAGSSNVAGVDPLHASVGPNAAGSSEQQAGSGVSVSQ